jgi:phosphoglycerate kinase
MAVRYIDEIELSEKRVLIRVDYNVPLDGSQKITNDTRIQRSLPTINYALSKNARVILMSHLGRPKGRVVPELSLAPVAQRLAEVLKQDVALAPDCVGPEVEQLVSQMKSKDVVLLENLRFHVDEEAGDKVFARKLAQLADVYIDDAFGVGHRAHASNVTIVEFAKESAAGFLMRDEIEYIHKLIENPSRPLVAVVGGAKVSSKLHILDSLVRKVDKIIIGGGMAFTFLHAKGFDVGKSLVEDDLVGTAWRIIDSARERRETFYLPVDCVVAERLDPQAATKVVPIQEIPLDWMALDIGPATSILFAEVLQDAKTIIWNGPMGVFEMDAFSNGTRAMIETMVESPALTIVGGGDTDVAVEKWNATDKMSYISTGGGAFIEMLEGKTLPAMKALEFDA